MKKLFITAVFALGSMTAFAQVDEATETQEPATDTQEQATEAQDAATDADAQDGFSEIAMEEVPEAVTSMIETNYPGHYKVEVSLEDGTSGALIVDEEGNAVEQ
jgi:hypothetical protein